MAGPVPRTSGPSAYSARPGSLAEPVPVPEQAPPVAPKMSPGQPGFAKQFAQPEAAPSPAPEPTSAATLKPGQPGFAQQFALPDEAAQQGPQSLVEALQQRAQEAVTQGKEEWRRIRSGDYENAYKQTAFRGTMPGEKLLVATLLSNTVNLDQQLKQLPVAREVQRGSNENEQMRIAQKMLGKQNVRSAEGTLEFRYPGDSQWRQLTRPGLELVTDVLGNSRQIAKEVALLPFEAAGGAVAGPTGVAVGRAAGEFAANPFADMIMKDKTGVAPDEGRSRLTENLLDAGLDLLVPFTQYQVAKRIPGTVAWNAVQLKKGPSSVAPPQIIAQQIEAARRVNDSNLVQHVPGDLVGQPGVDIALRLDQILPTDPKVLGMRATAANEVAFQAHQTAQAESLLDAVRSTLDNVAGSTSKTPRQLVMNLGSTIKQLDQAEGEAIGKFRMKALSQFGNRKLPVPEEINKRAADMMQNLGFAVKVKQGKGAKASTLVFEPPEDMKTVMGKFGFSNPGEARAFVNVLADFAEASQRGLNIQELEQSRKVVGNLMPKARMIGGDVKREWGQFASDLRQYHRHAVKAGLDNDVDRAAYDSVMDRFSSIRENSQGLQDVLEKDMTAAAITKEIFGKGKDGLENLRAVKSLVKADAPDTWAALKQTWFDDMLNKHSRDQGTGLDYRAMSKELNAYGPQFLSEVFDGSGIDLKTARDLMAYGKLLQNTYTKPGAAKTVSKKAEEALIQTGIGIMGRVYFKTVNGMQRALGIGLAGNPLNVLLNPKAIEEYVARHPTRINRQLATDNLKRLMGTASAQAMLSTATRALGQGAAISAQQGLRSGAVLPEEAQP